MLRKIIKGLFCALLCVILSVGQASAIEITGIGGATPNLGGEKEPATDAENLAANTPVEEVYVDEPLKYVPVDLSDSTKDFFATLDGDVTLTLVARQKDFVDGKYNEYFCDLYAEDSGHYRTFINTLKTISELNDYVKLQFIDPFSVSSFDFLDKYKKYDLQYGDLFINCYSNFEGTPTTRRALLKPSQLLKLKKKGKDGHKVVGVDIEKTLVEKLESLIHFRNVNVAYISDLCNEANIQYLKTYLKGKRYSFDSVTLKSEKLKGYDMIMIAAPVRDLMLEEIVILNEFMDNEGAYGKSLFYFCPETYVRLPNLRSFLQRWGIETYEKNKLFAKGEEGWIIKHTQFLAESTGTDYSKAADSEGYAYVMDNCTPIRIAETDDKIKVTPLLKTGSDDVIYMLKSKSYNSKYAQRVGEEYPLVTLSRTTNRKGTPSRVVVFASVDFITGYFARQNPKIDKDYQGDRNNNFNFTYDLLETLNQHHRSRESGLGKYAVGIADMGYDVTSGLKTRYILQVAIISVALFIILFVGLLAFCAARNAKRLNKSQKSEEK